MKDPLQTEQTPYEVLGVDVGASDDDIKRAFRTGLGQPGGEPAELREARTCLLRSVDCAMVNMLLYDDEVVCNLVPSPTTNPALLEPSQRLATARSWERELRNSFPDYGVAHALAVLYYWWAVHLESGSEESSKSDGAPPPNSTELWRKAIGYWSMCLCSDDFGQEVMMVDAATHEELKNRFRTRLLSRFQDLSKHHKEAGRLGLELETELRTAAEMHRVRVTSRQGVRICCGAQSLRALGLLDDIRGQIAARLEDDPEDSRMKALCLALSDYASIHSLVESKDYKAAAAAIEALPPDQRRTEEVRSLYITTMLELGSQEEEVGRHAEAIDCWGKVVEAWPDSEEAGEARTRLVAMCGRLVAAWGRERRSETIELLEYALAAIRDSSLEELLADELTNEAVATINDAQEKAQNGGELTKKAEEKLRKRMQHALVLLERAAELGSERAREQLETGRGVVEQLEKSLRFSHEARAMMQRAEQAASEGDHDEAIKALSEMVELLEEELPEDSKEHLAAVLCKRGVMRVHAAMQTLKDAQDRLEREMDGLVTIEEAKSRFVAAIGGGHTDSQVSRMAYLAILSRHLGRDLLGGGLYGINEPALDRLLEQVEHCSKCHRPMFESSWTLNLPRPGTYKVCESCKNHLDSLISAAHSLGNRGRELALDGHRDIAEAHELDPSNEHAKEQLEQARSFLSQCEVAIPRRARRTARRKAASPKRKKRTAAKEVASSRREKPAAAEEAGQPRQEETTTGAYVWSVVSGALLVILGIALLLRLPEWWIVWIFWGIGGAFPLIDGIGGLRKARADSARRRRSKSTRGREKTGAEQSRKAASGEVNWDAKCQCGSGKVYRECCGRNAPCPCGSSEKYGLCCGRKEKSMVVNGVPYYGAQLDEDKMFLFVRKNDQYPTPASERVWLTLSASRRNQRILHVPIYGGDDEEQASANGYLGEACMLLPAGLSGHIKARMSLWLDDDGVLKMDAHLADVDEKRPKQRGQTVLYKLGHGAQDQSALRVLEKLEQKCLDSHATSDKKRRAKLRTGLNKAFKAWINGDHEQVELTVKALLYGTPPTAGQDRTARSRKRSRK